MTTLESSSVDRINQINFLEYKILLPCILPSKYRAHFACKKKIVSLVIKYLHHTCMTFYTTPYGEERKCMFAFAISQGTRLFAPFFATLFNPITRKISSWPKGDNDKSRKPIFIFIVSPGTG